MRILLVTNMFAGANPLQPAQGVFVSEQVDALRRVADTEIDVVVVKGFASRLYYAMSLLTILFRLCSKRYDIVHYHFGLTAWSAPLVRFLARKRIVITLHGSDVFGPPMLRRVTRMAIRFAHVCIAVSEEIRRDVTPLARHCVTIPCAVNDALFCPPTVRVIETAKIVVFPSSTRRPEKDHALFTDAIERVRRIVPYPVAERCIDGLDREGVRDLLQQADALVMTSRREGSPQSIKEAMACGLPIVSVNVGDVAQVLNGVEGCHVVRGRNPADIAGALGEVLASGQRTNGPARLAELGYLSTQIAARVSTVYRRVARAEPPEAAMPTPGKD
ncbi:glycosyltransferase family 4 protein [Paraburkholderia sp. BCC1885]|uniref:glycosyltransferase family 4 protein n=1 Tax=Paraburkholderia sp. BCC1885 TaxID=2562669 RepID=UPI0011831DF8|nr:glycosyltransferase family 4 protein [Paraburkholderia sp. BCC1885]